MDNIDYRILAALKKNARMKASEISREIHLSVSSVIDRIRKLESSGVIQAYTIVTNEALVGNDLTALMEISLEHPRYTENFVRYLQSDPHIVSCYYLAGEFDYMIKICCQSARELERLHRSIKQQEGVRMTKTHYVLQTEKNIYTSLPRETEEDT